MFGFVTGASSGIGEGFARRLAADGWDLAITARRGGRLRALAGRLAGEHGVRVQTCVADLTDPGDLAGLERVVAAAEPDLLVNNAGLAGYREFCDVDPTGGVRPGRRARHGRRPLGQGGGTRHGRARVRGDHQRGVALAFAAPASPAAACRAVYAAARRCR